jgi:hypothetical protein
MGVPHDKGTRPMPQHNSSDLVGSQLVKQFEI